MIQIAASSERTRGDRLGRHLVAVAAAAGLALTGCASESAPQDGPVPGPPPVAPVPTDVPLPGPQAEAVEWANSVCEQLRPLITTLDAPPRPNLGDPAATKQEYSSYLENASSEVQRALDGLPDAGPAVEGGQQVIDDVRTQLEQLRDDLNEAAAQINQADPSNPGTVVEAARAAGNVLGAQGNVRQVLNQITQNAQLNVAYERAPQCRFE